MLKKTLSFALSLALLLGLFSLSASALDATPTASTVLVNGENVAFDAYLIAENNYFKLRDLAFVLNGTAKQFEVTWDNEKGAINLVSGAAYTVVGGEMEGKGAGAKTPVPNASKIYLNGVETAFTAYTIEGNNYFKLRDIGQTFDFGVDWDGARNTIVIDTGKGYTPEGGATPPAPPSSSGALGNSTSNIMNGGYLATDGEWVYALYDRMLYKMRPDGSSLTKINDDHPTCINVLNGWIYYVNGDFMNYIYKVRPDGTGKTQVNEESSSSVYIVGDWAYYTTMLYDEGVWTYQICRIKTDGTGRTVLLEGAIGAFCVSGDWIYYSVINDDGYATNVYKIKTDGTGKTLLVEGFCSWVVADGDWVYYTLWTPDDPEADGLYKIRTDGTGKAKLPTKGRPQYTNVSGGSAYFDDLQYGHSLSKIGTDGTGLVELMNIEFRCIHILGDWLYYLEPYGMATYKMKLDGTEWQVVFQ